MRNRPTAPAIAAAIALTVSLSACSSGGTTESPSQTADGPVDLRMVVFSSNPDHLNLLNDIADRFVEQSDSVAGVEFESVAAGDLVTVLTTQISSDEAPDLSWMTAEVSRTFIDSGALLDVSDTLKDDEAFDYADLIPELQVLWQRDGAQYGVPFSTSTKGMYYNRDIFTSAGVPLPEDLIAEGEWDWDTFRDISKQITEATEVPGHVFGDFNFDRWSELSPIFKAFGAEPWDETATECQMDSPEMVSAMELINNMTFVDRSSPLPGQQVDFYAGQAASTGSFISRSGLLAEAQFDWGFVPMPAGPAGAVPALYQSAIVAFAGSKHPEQAAEFLAFLTNKENSAMLAQYFPPARESLLNPEVLAKANPLLTAEQLDDVVVEGALNGDFIPVSNNDGEVSSTLNGLLNENVFFEGADVASGLSQVCEGLAPVLEATDR